MFEAGGSIKLHAKKVNSVETRKFVIFIHFVTSCPSGVFGPNWTNSFSIISGNLLHRIDKKRKNEVQ